MLKSKKNDILLNITGASVARCCLVPDNILPARVNQHVAIIRIDGNKADPRYVFLCLVSPNYKNHLLTLAQGGATREALTKTTIEDFGLELLELGVQSRTADVVMSYDNLIENNNRRIAILEDMAQSLYREWFVKFRFPWHEVCQFKDSALGRVPEGWEVAKFGDLVEFLRESVKKGAVEENTPYMGLEHFPRKSLPLSEWECVNEIGSSKLRFKKGDILFGKIRPYFHKVGVAQTEGLCSSDTFVWRSKEQEYLGLIASVAFSDDFVIHSVQTSQGTKMPHANWGVLKEYLVVIAPKQLLCKFNKLVSSTIEEISTLSTKNRNLKEQRDMFRKN